ncbi:MAG: ice-binding family protein [Gemmatimonadales bacterium]
MFRPSLGLAARLLAIVPFAALVGLACEHSDPVGPSALTTITVTPDPQSLPISGIQPFVATGTDADGNLVSITPTWSVVAGGGTIDTSSGLFAAGTATGTFTNTVRATSGDISGFATVTVTAPGELVAIVVTPNPGGAVVGGTIQFAAEGQDATGAVVALASAPTWSVVAGGGTIDAATGLFTAGAMPGTFINTVKATSGNVSGFATAVVTSGPPPGPPLGTAATYGILAGSTVSCVIGGFIDADIGIYPGTALTGFGPGVCSFSGSSELGTAVAQTAQNNLTTAYDVLVALPCNTVVTPADIGGRTLPPGVYCVASSLEVTGTVTLDGQGDANARFVFQMGSTLTTGTSANIALINGAQAQNVWWQVGSSATLGTGTTFRGNILALQSITLVDNATMLGRALARNGAVELGTNNTITLP